MLESERKRQLGRVLEEERSFYFFTIKPLGDYYHEFIRSYGEEDRGLSKLLQLTNYLFPFEPEGNNSREEGVISGFKEMTLDLLLYIPAMKEELVIMKRIEDELSESLKKSLKGVKRTPPVLMPDEVADVAFALSALRIYMDYRYAYNEIRSDILMRGKGLRSLLDRYKGVIRNFIRSMEEGSDFYLGWKILPYSIVTFFSVDAHDNSLLRDFLKTEDKELLLTYVPTKGLNEVLFEKKDSVMKKFRESLEYRRERKEMCLVSSLQSRLDLKKLQRYYNELYPPSYTL